MLSTLFVRLVEPELRSLEEILGIKRIDVDYITGNTYIPVRKAQRCRVCGELLEKNATFMCDPDPREL